jgi:hypothetical protein
LLSEDGGFNQKYRNKWPHRRKLGMYVCRQNTTSGKPDKNRTPLLYRLSYLIQRNSASSPHDQTVIELLRENPIFTDGYLSAVLDKAGEPGGKETLLPVFQLVFKLKSLIIKYS